MKKIELSWMDEDFVIPEKEVFEVGEQIEEIVTLGQLSAMANNPRFHKLARCYSLMINHAGGNATPEKVYAVMMAQIKTGSEKQLVAAAAINTLAEILMDGAPESDDDGDDEKKAVSSSKAAT